MDAAVKPVCRRRAQFMFLSLALFVILLGTIGVILPTHQPSQHLMSPVRQQSTCAADDASLVIVTGFAARGIVTTDDLRRVAPDGCAYVVALQPANACAPVTAATRSPQRQSDRAFAEDNGLDAQLHTGYGACDALTAPSFRRTMDGRVVHRVCADEMRWQQIIASLRVKLNVTPNRTTIINLSLTGPRATMIQPDPPSCCQQGSAQSACASRRRHIHRLRQLVMEQDAYAAAVPFRNRFNAGRLPALSVSADAAPPSCDRVLGADHGLKRTTTTMAVDVTGPADAGLRKALASILEHTSAYDVALFVHAVVQDVSRLRPDEVAVLRFVASLPRLAALLVTTTEFASLPNLRGDHPNGANYMAVYPGTSVETTLSDLYRVAVTGLLRRMYEQRCGGGRFDLVMRIRSDACLRAAVNGTALLADGTLVLGGGEKPLEYPRSIGTDFAVGPPSVVDRVLDLYFRLPSVAMMGFHPESNMYGMLERDGLLHLLREMPSPPPLERCH